MKKATNIYRNDIRSKTYNNIKKAEEFLRERGLVLPERNTTGCTINNDNHKFTPIPEKRNATTMSNWVLDIKDYVCGVPWHMGTPMPRKFNTIGQGHRDNIRAALLRH